MYHPPNSYIDDTIECISSTLSLFTKKCPLATHLFGGDFNHLPVEGLLEQMGIHNLVNFTCKTHKEAKLDLVLSNMTDYKPADQLAPIMNCDHCCILSRNHKVKRTSKYIRTRKRLITSDRKIRVLIDIGKESWDDVLKVADVHTKAEAFHFK
jgi:hypothetical protein